MGCTEGWVTHATLRAYRSVSFPHRWAVKAARAAYKGYWFRIADGWVVQTESARQGLARRCRVPSERIAVVPNSCSPLYFEQSADRPVRSATDKWTILCFAAAYPHKRLEFIPFVAKQLMSLDPALNFQFVLTLPPQSSICRRVMNLAKSLSVTGNIRNEGEIPFVEGPALYERADISFLPTVLETFSANYPEAMAMNVPIVTTDLGFARDVCQDAALYFKPDDPESAARQLHRVVRDGSLRQQLLSSGKSVLSKLPSPRDQYRRYTELLTRVATKLPLLGSAERQAPRESR
jgi:glycosyltransferase involved in cell wall biosynthesis